jgi:hypothetical protein
VREREVDVSQREWGRVKVRESESERAGEERAKRENRIY